VDARVSFIERLGLAVVFVATASGVELALRGRRATRWRSALVLAACGSLGAALGCAIDLLTSTLGPAYFAVGKGLGDAPGLTLRALGLGAQAGAAAGVIVAAILLLRAGRRLSRIELRSAAARIARTVGGGVALGALAGALAPSWLVTDAGF